MNLTIPMTPVAKGRPRFKRIGNFVTTYPDKNTAKAEKFIKAYARSLNLPMFAAGIPLHMDITFYMKRPKSAKKRLYPVVKPDCTNLIKTIEDGLNGVLYHDDNAIVSIRAQKLYGEPRIEVSIEEIR